MESPPPVQETKASTKKDRHVVAVVGGAVSGSAAAQILAQREVLVVILEQNPRPYGKIEDGLPRWHAAQRLREYRKIDQRLHHPNILYVPCTKLGEDVSFDELTLEWGLSAVVLANGAWQDRFLPIDGIERFHGKGLLCQNPLVYWFNHKHEQGYSGPRHKIPQGAIVVGGGLASIDSIKIVQLELYHRALRQRGIQLDILELEHRGIPAVCAAHGIAPKDLEVANGRLFYRRRAEDMPLVTFPGTIDPEKLQRMRKTRQKILQKSMDKFLFEFYPEQTPVAPIVEGDRLAGLRFRRTRQVDGRVKTVEGTETDYRSDLCVSSIGSVPRKIPGIQTKGDYYWFSHAEDPSYVPRQGVFAVGNVVTGKGNIRISLKHGQEIAERMVLRYLGLAERGDDLFPPHVEWKGQSLGASVVEWIEAEPPLPPEQVRTLVQRVHHRWKAVGYDGDYAAWIEKMTPVVAAEF